MKASKYCTKFQTNEQIGSLQGIDTCSIINVVYLRFISVIIDESESSYIAIRPEINYLLTKLQREIYLPIYAVNEMRCCTTEKTIGLGTFHN